MLASIIYIFISFFIGAIPTGFIIGKIKKIDIRKEGSKNIGATNVTRTLGPIYGSITLLLDCLKAFLPLLLFKPFIDYFNIKTLFLSFDFWHSLVAIFIIFGNIFNPFLGFKGGKGVATGLGVMLFLNPYGVLISLLIFIIIVTIFKYISLGSLVAVFSIIIFSLIFVKSYFIICAIILIGLLVIFRHKENIKRLLNGTENKFSLKRK